MATIEFLSWRGLRRLVTKLWERIDAIFLRKTDPKVAHLSYDEDSSTLHVDSSVQADYAAFKVITVGDASVQGEYEYDRIEETIVDSSNPIMAQAVYALAVEVRNGLADINKQIKEIWEYIKDASNPSYAGDETLQDKLEGLTKDVGVLDGVLGSLIEGQSTVGELPSSVYTLDASNDNTMYVNPV